MNQLRLAIADLHASDSDLRTAILVVLLVLAVLLVVYIVQRPRP